MVRLFNKDQGLANGSVFTWAAETVAEVLGQFESLEDGAISEFGYKTARETVHTGAAPLRG